MSSGGAHGKTWLGRGMDLLSLGILFAIMWGATYMAPGYKGEAAVLGALGFLLLAGTLLSELVEVLGMPHLTGYLFAGIIAGPYVLHLVDHTAGGRHPGIDFAAHARSLGAAAAKAAGIAELEVSLQQARRSDRTFVVVIESDPTAVTASGGHWWDEVVPEVSERAEVRAARVRYEDELAKRG